MTIDVAHTRSKRRRLPRRSIVDYEYVAPSKNTNLEQNLGLLPSARLRSVVSEVWGGGGGESHYQPIVIEPQTKGTKTKKSLMSGTKSLLERLKEHEVDMDLDLSKVVIIPPKPKPTAAIPLSPVDTNVYNSSYHHHQQQRITPEPMDTPSSLSKEDDDDTCTTTLDSHATSIMVYTNYVDEIMLSEGITTTSTTTINTLPDQVLSIKEEEEKDAPLLDDDDNNNSNDDEDDVYITAGEDEEILPNNSITNNNNNHNNQNDEDETVKQELNEEKREELKQESSMDTTLTQTKEANMHISLSPKENTLSPKENTLSPEENTLSPEENAFSPNQNILRKWLNVQKSRAKHSMLRMLKKSSALDWIEDGPDLDVRKEDVGMLRKQQLSNKLNKPFLERKQIQKKSSWFVSASPKK